MRGEPARLAAVVTAVLAAWPALAAGGNADKLVIRVVAPQKGGAGLTVTSSAFKEGAAIPERYAGYRIGPSPPLAWTKGPQGTQSYALLVEDPDAPGAEPFVHWVAYDIPADARGRAAPCPAARCRRTSRPPHRRMALACVPPRPRPRAPRPG